MANKYKDHYYEYTDATDEGADARQLTAEQQADVQRFKDAWQKYYEAGDQKGMDRAHAGAEAVRAQAGYSGGANGGAYNPFADGGDKGVHVSDTHMTSPAWKDPYQSERDATIKQIQSQGPFEWDKETDPLYQQYRDTYTRMGEKAMKDTIGAMRSRGGGQISSYAEIAAQQANQAYLQMLNDKVPELRQLAYEMYLKEGDRLRADAQMYDSMSSSDASRWSATVLDPFLSDRDFAANREDATWEKRYKERAYQDERDDVAWEKAFKEEDRDYTRQEAAAELVSKSGDFSGYGKLYGLTDTEVQALERLWQETKDKEDRVTAMDEAISQFQYARDVGGMEALGWDVTQALKQLALENQQAEAQIAATNRSNRGGSGGGYKISGGDNPGDGMIDATDIYREMQKSENPAAYLQLNYKALGVPYNQIDSFLSGYQEWAAGQPQGKNYESLMETIRRIPPSVTPEGMQYIKDQIQQAYQLGTISDEELEDLGKRLGYN